MAASVWKGHISFGLITIPVRLLRAARSERVPLRELFHVPGTSAPKDEPTEDEVDAARAAPTIAPVHGQMRVDPKSAGDETAPSVEPVRRIAVGRSSEEPVPAASITKGYEYEQGRFVTIAPEELRSIVPSTSADMEIVEFVRLAEIDPVYFEASYYVKPGEPGRKPYALLYEAMREAGFAAVGQFAMHRRDRVAILRPGPTGLMAHTMYFASEVRSDQEVRADKSLVTPKEVALAKSLVSALAGPFEPAKYHDKYRERLEALIAAKVEGKETVSVAASAPHSRPAVDIIEALRKSLEAVKKPAAKANEVPRRRPLKKTGSR
ncbi:MAG TPA: Ku protein [Bryobacteraceae bacterium]|jgi:DNA end-binding protein Ku|nr:Ku protein [Bryobacteraceae bacterium]